MIITPEISREEKSMEFMYPNFRLWQSDTLRRRMIPLVGVAGTRGKSTVTRLMEAVLQSLRFKIVTWTDLGVQIRGRNQRAELAGWSRALQRLAESSLDIGLQELDWAAVTVAGLPAGMYPVMVHTGLRDSSDS